MRFEAETLLRLLPAIHRIRDSEAAVALGSLLTPDEVAELVGLDGLPSPTPEQKARRSELRARAGSLLSPQEQSDLISLAALPTPSDTQLSRLLALREKSGRGPLKALLTAFAHELAVMEENLAQLYDDLFIETCADWAIPYIGDLIGYEPLHGLGNGRRAQGRAEVAHTIALRRRKGTAAVLEQLARDVTGWHARVVEYFQLLGATQHMNHPRKHCLYAPDMRRWEPLARIGSAFEAVAHTVDVRRIESQRGRFNIPNVGLFLWRLDAFGHTQSPAVRVDDRRYLVSPLGHPLQLYTSPVPEDEIEHLAEPINVPDPITRRQLHARPDLYYGTRPSLSEQVDNVDPSIVLLADGNEVPRSQIKACNLMDHGGAWAHVPPDGKYGIDPVLGRIALAADLPVPRSLSTSYHYGFSAAMGGGEYPREREPDAAGTTVLRVPGNHPTIAGALAALGGNGVVEITNSSRYEEALAAAVQDRGHVIVRAGADCRPTLVLTRPLDVTGGVASAFSLEGLLVSGNGLRVPNAAGNKLARLRVVHATLVPGQSLSRDGAPVSTSASVEIALLGVALELSHAIVGALWVVDGSTLAASNSIVDATEPTRSAFCAPNGTSSGGEMSLDACTVIGKINAESFGLVSNSILLARREKGDTLPPVRTVRRQAGCVRFSYLPFDSLVPRRHRCQPATATVRSDVAPRFTSLRYGVAAYCQLSRTTPDEIRLGADDESEMGAFHALFAPQREANLQIRLREFLRVGLASGILCES